MNFCGIICEYNPLHNGHVYHLQSSVQKTGADAVICVMSGNFVQRGLPAIADKYARAVWAVRGGADIVVELPAVFAVSAAPDFAYGAIRLLSAVKSVNSVCFGSESGEIYAIEQFTEKLNSADIKAQLKKGSSYAAALKGADGENFKSNNILAAEYLRSLKRLKSHIVPYTVKRADFGYNSSVISGEYCSATAIREKIFGGFPQEIAGFLPRYVYDEICQAKSMDGALFNMLSYKILTAGVSALKECAGVSEGLENRIAGAIKNADTLPEFMELLRTKRYPDAKLNRILISILLGISKAEVKNAKKMPPYARVLAVKRGKENLISVLAKDIDVIVRYSDYKRHSGNFALETDVLATDIYAKLTKNTKLNDLNSGLTVV